MQRQGTVVLLTHSISGRSGRPQIPFNCTLDSRVDPWRFRPLAIERLQCTVIEGQDKLLWPSCFPSICSQALCWLFQSVPRQIVSSTKATLIAVGVLHYVVIF